MNVLSLFDGMSCGQIALKELGIKVGKYYAAEIDKFAIQQTQHNFPETIQLGSVTEVKAKCLEKIDLIIGGSPCQGFSFAGKQLNFDDPRSALFFEFVRLWKEVKKINPKAKFLLENVNMAKAHLRVISEYMGVFPVRINSNLVSAQNRDRWYWTNIRTKDVGLFEELWSDIPQPEDKGILLKDVLQPESEVDSKYYLNESAAKGLLLHKERAENNGWGFGAKLHKDNDKFNALKVGGRGTDDIYCVAMRGCGDNNKQQLEPKTDGKTNCLTSVQKDNLVMTKNYVQFDVSGKGHKSQQDRAFYENGKHGALASSRAETKNGVAIRIPEATAKGYAEVYPGECVDLEHPNSKTRRGRKMDTKSNCLMAAQNSFTRYTEDFRLRRLTPLECSRLQTIPEWYEWVVSDTQIYTMLGNGWTVDVIKHIFSFLE